MAKNKQAIIHIIYIIIFLACIIGGMLILSNYNKDTIQKPQILSYYSGNYYSENKDLIEQLNDNKVDKKFITDFENADTPEAEAIVIGNWIDFYDDSIQKLYSKIESLIDSNTNDALSDTSNKANVELNYLKNVASKYMKAKSIFFEEFHVATVGHGTESSAMLGLYELNEKRILLFEMIELTHNIISVTYFDD